ncbi:NAD(P)H-dependent oxidoreductase [Leifsonia sp. ZF2019]|uniref:NADPH-dependent FMN reductase n=1 Tax=Leifsonia sp. ZF2019 TaxID=2781978 RepID=UPI001CBCCE70|nr:NAD(P)H-dependent oxidoreductase [Leifsonia sp. ZF2019]UAJ81204.1 NAD(P)H-dependent oxidoreductase [Leifsonia sp. ZF2019]
MSKLKIIVGSTRPTRMADRVAPWVTAAARAHSGFEVEVLDLMEWDLPLFAEHFGTLGDPADPTYSQPLVKRWNRTIADGDAFLIITPEYNHSVPAALKNAIDTVWASNAFRNKPVAFVGYSAGIGGGIRSIEHLVQIAVEAEAVPLRSAVIVPFVNDAFGDDGLPTNPITTAGLSLLLEDLAWWSTALERARAAGELPPARARLRPLLAAAAGKAS